MSPRSLKRQTFLVIATLALIAASCSGGTETATSTNAPTTTEAPTPTPAPVVALTAQERADQVIIVQADAPTGYTVLDDVDDDDTSCDGVADVGALFPPDGVRRVELDGGTHFFGAQVFVYDDESVAEAAFAYAEELTDLCDGRFSTDETGEAALFEFFDSAAPAVDADQRAGFRFVVSTPDVGVSAHQYIARIGGIAMVASGTDEATTRYLLATMVARLLGTDQPPIVEPEGSARLLPGLEATSDGTGSDEAGILRAAIRQIPDFSEQATSWLDQATDADIDAVAAAACTALAGDGVDDVEATLTSMYEDLGDDDQAALDVASYGQLVGATLVIYCPDVFAALES